MQCGELLQEIYKQEHSDFALRLQEVVKNFFEPPKQMFEEPQLEPDIEIQSHQESPPTSTPVQASESVADEQEWVNFLR